MSAERRPAWVADAAVAAATAVFLMLTSGHIPPAPDERAIDAFGYGLLVTAAVATGLARRRPRLALAVVGPVLVAYAVRHYAGGPVFATAWYVLVQLRRRTGRATAVAGAAALCAVLVGTAVVIERRLSLVSLVFVGWAAAAVLLGDVVESRHRHLAELGEREARRRVAEERLRIARDLHDSVAHAMATISVQAGAAAHVVDRKPEAAKEALVAIRRAGGEVLDELTAMLALLRDDDEAADRAPTPGLDRVADLVDTGRANGLPVALAVEGPVERVPVAVGTAAFRIVQESLTNVLRHAPGATARVAVTATADGGFTVEVTDDGARGPAAVAPAGAGVGLRGMRERAASTGGRLTAGPRPGGGFAVRAEWAGRP